MQLTKYGNYGDRMSINYLPNSLVVSDFGFIDFRWPEVSFYASSHPNMRVGLFSIILSASGPVVEIRSYDHEVWRLPASDMLRAMQEAMLRLEQCGPMLPPTDSDDSASTDAENS